MSRTAEQFSVKAYEITERFSVGFSALYKSFMKDCEAFVRELEQSAVPKPLQDALLKQLITSLNNIQKEYPL